MKRTILTMMAIFVCSVSAAQVKFPPGEHPRIGSIVELVNVSQTYSLDEKVVVNLVFKGQSTVCNPFLIPEYPICLELNLYGGQGEFIKTLIEPHGDWTQPPNAAAWSPAMHNAFVGRQLSFEFEKSDTTTQAENSRGLIPRKVGKYYLVASLTERGLTGPPYRGKLLHEKHWEYNLAKSESRIVSRSPPLVIEIVDDSGVAAKIHKASPETDSIRGFETPIVWSPEKQQGNLDVHLETLKVTNSKRKATRLRMTFRNISSENILLRDPYFYIGKYGGVAIFNDQNQFQGFLDSGFAWDKGMYSGKYEKISLPPRGLTGRTLSLTNRIVVDTLRKIGTSRLRSDPPHLAPGKYSIQFIGMKIMLAESEDEHELCRSNTVSLLVE